MVLAMVPDEAPALKEICRHILSCAYLCKSAIDFRIEIYFKRFLFGSYIAALGGVMQMVF
jgi:hypothetical protein